MPNYFLLYINKLASKIKEDVNNIFGTDKKKDIYKYVC